MTGFLRALAALLRQALLGMLQYRGELALWAFWGVVYPAVALAMWSAALQGTDGATEIGGFDQRQFAAYFLLTMVVGHFVTAWDAYEMGYLVQSGALSPALLRPMLPLWRSLCDNVAYKLITLIILIPLWLGVAWLTNPALEAGPAQVAVGLVALVLGAAINYIWGYNIALLAFWTTRTDAISEFWFGGTLIFGGRLAPITLLPAGLDLLAQALPFKWIIWFPSEVLIGRVPLDAALVGLIWQAAWVGLGVVVFRVFWRIGLRRYSSVGA